MENGKFFRSGQIINDKFSGKVFNYDTNGQILFEEEYKDGISMSAWGENINEEGETESD